MKDLKNISTIHFIGIGGIGMSALARFFNSKGVSVTGYDKTKTTLTQTLEKEGINITYTDSEETVTKNVDVVVVTPAVPPTNNHIKHYISSNTTIYKRSEVLGLLTKDHFTIAIAGSHGKTTVSAMVTHVLKSSGYDCTAFLGGISANYRSNYIEGDNNVVVVEADEYDRSFLQLSPDILVVTSIDSDHLDVYGSFDEIQSTFENLTGRIKDNGVLISSASCNLVFEPQFKYSLTKGDHISLLERSYTNREYLFSVQVCGESHEGFKLKTLGIHNIENSLAAIAVAKRLNINMVDVKEALSSFKGIKRRFEFIMETENCVFIDDYAHHPTEIASTIRSVRELFPEKQITSVFQPHLYSRTKDLAAEFASSLDLSDRTILLPIYPAREEPIEGVGSGSILEHMKNQNAMVLTKDESLEWIKKEGIEVLLTLGAGDIDKMVDDFKQILTVSHEEN